MASKHPVSVAFHLEKWSPTVKAIKNDSSLYSVISENIRWGLICNSQDLSLNSFYSFLVFHIFYTLPASACVLRCIQLCVTPWTIACQASLSTRFSKQEYWSRVAISSSSGSFQPRGWTDVSCFGRGILYHWATWGALYTLKFPEYHLSCSSHPKLPHKGTFFPSTIVVNFSPISTGRSQEDSLEEGLATHSSILDWRIPGTEEFGRLWSIGLQRVEHNWSNLACIQVLTLPFPPPPTTDYSITYNMERAAG